MLLRSLLYVPGNRSDMIRKAVSLWPDVIILDLEDSVPEHEKVPARSMVKESAETLTKAGHTVFLRINGFGSAFALGDLADAFGPAVKGVVIPKVEEALEVELVNRVVRDLEAKYGIPENATRLVATTESALGVVNSFAIANAAKRAMSLCFGAGDLALDLGASWPSDESHVLYARQKVALDAAAAKVHCIDGVYQDFRDLEGLERHAQSGKSMGYKGQVVIHPSQIDTVNKVYGPGEEEIKWAERVIEVFEKAVKQGSGTTSLDGKMMIDAVHYKRAKSILETVDAIKGASSSSATKSSR